MTTTGASLLPPDLRLKIENAIADSATAWSEHAAQNLESAASSALAMAVKYVPSAYAAKYKAANAGLFIGSNNFTWGRGVYVTGVEQPLSTAIYGRAGLVARFDPAGWRAFDARDPTNQQLYLHWLQAQVTYAEAVLTVHSDHFLHGLRNVFREQFAIDVVLFRPDEGDAGQWYTSPDDTWMAVSDWEPGIERRRGSQLRQGYSGRFSDVRLTILIEEEFAPDDPALTRSPQLVLSGAAPSAAGWPARVRAAYSAGTIERVPS
jgi:hypothetical protein